MSGLRSLFKPQKLPPAARSAAKARAFILPMTLGTRISALVKKACQLAGAAAASDPPASAAAPCKNFTVAAPMSDGNHKTLRTRLCIIGSGPTAHTALEWAVSALMRNPAAMVTGQREVREGCSGGKKESEEDVGKMNHLSLVMKETLRLHPPVPLLLPRESHETKQVLGYQILAKTKVLVNAWALARDPQIWEDAEEWFMESGVDFSGTNLEFIPFGPGGGYMPELTYGLGSVQLFSLDRSATLTGKCHPQQQQQIDAQTKNVSDELDNG